jgi:hypothetical protein
MSNGILYIASGRRYIEEAVKSAKSLKRTNDMPITIVCDRSPKADCFDEIISGDDFLYHYGDSILQIPELPYERTLLLDTDTLICGSIIEVFDVLDQFDIAASVIADNEFEVSGVPKSFPEYNTGVVAFKKSDLVESFITDWKETYQGHLSEGVRMNQPSFRQTLYESDLRVATLPTEYNCRINFGGHLRNKVKIMHGSIEKAESLVQKINDMDTSRVYYKNGDKLAVESIDTVNQGLVNQL